ncbi:hypothetical protein NCC49_003647 [Naganishia albida]|nr:hypothetical protein NCC49_003647 [Naganishia albida]
MSTSMRGLTQYISDLRACRVRELEEKRINREMAHIRQKFREGNLDGYQKKKYLAKVVFTYILGYKVDVGHMEAVNLISSNKYSEKQIGYLAITLLMHENSELIRLVINSIRKDLDDSNEVNNCLALNAIANIGGKEMAESLGADVHRLLISPTSTTFVKKKSALTLLRFYRKHPSVLPVEEWADRLVRLMDDRDPGVVLTVTTLVMALAHDHLDAYAMCYQKAVDRLTRLVFDRDFPSDYVYYKVPIPWLQVKLLRLLQYYPPPENKKILKILNNTLNTIINNSQETPKNVQHNNAQNAVLFEAINLAIHIDPESQIVSNAAKLLGRFILAKETNVRYLGLDAMAHLAAVSESLTPIKKHQDTIILSLKDRDISVRRRGLDLLYSMCDTSNAKTIVGELLKYLQVADYNLREEMVLKIAILTERFATEYEWYVDTVLQLISTAGDHVGPEVWYRVVQLVTNNEDLQAYAAKAVYTHLQMAVCHENMIKVGGYILGEFGHLIANDEGCSPIEQFHAVHSKINICSAATRSLLLTTYIKWVNLFPEIKDQLVAIFERYRHVLDAELQQRACEYLAIATRNDDNELLEIVCEEMPPFPERESALLTRLHGKSGANQDNRTWVIGGKSDNQERQATRYRSFTQSSAGGPPAAALAYVGTNGQGQTRQETEEPEQVENLMGADEDVAESTDIMSSLAGLNMGEPSAAQEAPLLNSGSTMQSPTVEADTGAIPTAEPISTAGALAAMSLTKGHGIEKWLERLIYNNEGVLYEDEQVQIGLKAEYHGHLGRIALYFGNKIPQPFTSFSASIESLEPSAVEVKFHKEPAKEIAGLTQVQHLISIDCKRAFTRLPIIKISFIAGTVRHLALRLPIFLSKFVEPIELESVAFFERWKVIGGPPREAQKIFPIQLVENGDVDIARNKKIVQGQKFEILGKVDPNPLNLVAAGVLQTSTGKIGILIRLEPNKDASLARLTIRSTNDVVSAEILELIAKPLNKDTMAAAL